MFTAGCLRQFSLVFILSFLFGGIFEPACVAVYVAHYVEGYLKRGCALFDRNGRGRALFDRACERVQFVQYGVILRGLWLFEDYLFAHAFGVCQYHVVVAGRLRSVVVWRSISASFFRKSTAM